MIVALSFYIVSLFLVYFDCTRYTVPNELIALLAVMVVLFGLLEGSATWMYLILPLFLIVFFYVVSLLGLGFVGSGDIKYLILISMYINHPLKFAWYLIISGILQLLFLLFYQKVKKRRFVPMVPAMFVAVVLCDIWI